MEDIILVCGRWKLERQIRWSFSVDERRGCRILPGNCEISFDEFLDMVYEDYGFDKKLCEVRLSYMLLMKSAVKTPDDTPPVFIGNERQFQGYLRQRKGSKEVRLCVEVEEKDFVSWNKEDGKLKTTKKEVESEQYKKSVKKKRKKDNADESIRKKGVWENVKEEPGIAREDEDEKFRFDYCDDSDGASSGDEDYRLYSKFSEKESHFEMEEKEVKEEVYGYGIEEKGECSGVRRKACCGHQYGRVECAAIDLAVGQQFESKDALERRVKILTVLHKFDFDVKRSRPHLYVVKCWVPGCKWRVRATTIGNSPTFHIRIYVSHHTCSITERSARARQATPEILGELYQEYVGGVGAGVIPNHVGQAMNLRYGIKMDYWKAHRTLKAARELVRGTPESGYASLPSYLYMIRKANPGTHTRLEVDKLDRFKYVFISFGACIDGFRFMRKVIVVDGTFLKGPFKGTLLLATTQDGNFNIFPLAFAVVDTENDESWEWFFTQLNCVIPDDERLAIISDRHKSIGNAIERVYPLASRGVCTYHLHKNILVRFSGKETFGLVKKAASAYRLADFNILFHQIQALNPALHSYLVRSDVRTWSRVHFPGDRFNFTTSNIAESINKVLNPMRNYPIVQLLDAVRFMLTRWFAARRKQASLMCTTLTKGVENLLEVRVDKAKMLDVQEIDQDQYEVSRGTSLHVVNLTRRSCSCRRFDLEKLPCLHAIAAAEHVKMSRIGQCSPYYRKDYLLNGYEKSIMPKDLSSPVPEYICAKVCKPPFVKNQPGRPKMARIKSQLEVALDRKRPRKPHACSKCGGCGHNRTTCESGV